MDQIYRREQLLYKNPANRVEVYKVFDTRTNVYAVLKIISTHRPEEVKAISDEAYGQASLQHSNICRVYDYFQEQSEGLMNCCIVLEFLDSDLLKDLTNRKNQGFAYTEVDLWTILRQVSSALAFAKSSGVAHRDIKPANILLSNAKECKVADFGTAKPTEQIIASHTVVGTPMYLSPQIREGMVKFRDVTQYNPYHADVYSLGITMVYLATLESPMKLGVLNGLEERITAEIQGIRAYSDNFRQVLWAMLRVREEDRISIEQVEGWCQAQLNVPSPQYYAQTAQPIPTNVDEARVVGQYEQSPQVMSSNPNYPSGYQRPQLHYSQTVQAIPTNVDEARVVGQYEQPPQVMSSNPNYPSGYQNFQQPTQSVFYSPYTPSATVQTAPSIPRPSSTVDRHKPTHCVNCKNRMATAIDDRIRLPCGGIVCCTLCFQKLTSPNCPTCRTPYDPAKYQY